MHEAAVVGVVERRRAVLRAAVVPQQCVADAPSMTVDEFVAMREVEQERDQLGRFLLRQPFDLACPAPYVERGPAAARVLPRDRMPDVGPVTLLRVGERFHVRIVHVMQAHAAEAGAPSRDQALHVGRKLGKRRVGVGKQRIAPSGGTSWA